jgi:hypothetical protein
MPRYFLHLKDSTDEILDPDGVEMPADALPAAALKSARDCIAGDVQDGRIDLHYRIEIFDELGTLVHRLPFSDAVEVVPTR